MLEEGGEGCLVACARIRSFQKRLSPAPVVGSTIGEAGGGMGTEDTMGEASV